MRELVPALSHANIFGVLISSFFLMQTPLLKTTMSSLKDNKPSRLFNLTRLSSMERKQNKFRNYRFEYIMSHFSVHASTRLEYDFTSIHRHGMHEEVTSISDRCDLYRDDGGHVDVLYLQPQSCGSSSYYDKMVRDAKLSSRIQSTPKLTGLGKGNKYKNSERIVNPTRNISCSEKNKKKKENIKTKKNKTVKCDFNIPTSDPHTSHRVACRDNFKKARDDKSQLHINDFIAQGLLPTIEVTTDNRTSNLMTSIVDQISKINDSGVTVNIDFITTIKKHFSNLLSKAKDQGIPLILGLSIAFCAVKAHYTKSPIWVALTTILTMITALYEFAAPLKILIEKLTKYAIAPIGAVDMFPAQRADGFEPQAFQFKDCISGTILTYVYTSLFADLKGANPVVDYLKKISDVPKMSTGIGFMVDFITKLVQGFLDHLTKWFGCREFILAQYPYPEAVTYSKDVDALLAEFNNGLAVNYVNSARFYRLEALSTTISSKIPSNTPEGREARHMVLMAKAALKPLAIKFARANITNNGPRIPPVGVMISGPSGMGKTAIMTFLMNAVSAAVLPESELQTFEENHNDTTFVRNSASAFWDGYHSQFNTYIDDIGQTIDVAGTDTNPFMEAISMLGPGNYPVPMAHLEDKGNVNFTSRMVYASTNRTKFRLNSLYYNEAFCRRWEISYVMVVRTDMCKPGFNFNDPLSRRVDVWPDTPRNDFHYLEFFPWNPESGEIGGVSITYEQLLAKIIEAYRVKYDSGAEMIKMHQLDKMIQLKKRREALKDTLEKTLGHPMSKYEDKKQLEQVLVEQSHVRQMYGPGSEFDRQECKEKGDVEKTLNYPDAVLKEELRVKKKLDEQARIKQLYGPERPAEKLQCTPQMGGAPSVESENDNDSTRVKLLLSTIEAAGLRPDEKDSIKGYQYNSSISDSDKFHGDDGSFGSGNVQVTDVDYRFGHKFMSALYTTDGKYSDRIEFTVSDLIYALSHETGLKPLFIANNYLECMEDDFDFWMLGASLVHKYECSQSIVKRFVRWSKDHILRWDTYKALAKKCLGVLAGVTTLLTTWSLAVRCTEYFFPAPMAAQSPTGHRKSHEYVKPTVHVKNGVKFRKVDLINKHSGRGHMQLRGLKDTHIEQAATDNASVDQLRSIVRKAQYCIRLPGSEKPMGKINFVVPYVAIMPAHFGERISYGFQTGEFNDDTCIDIWSVVTPEILISIPIQQCEMILSEKANVNDWCLMRIPHVISKTPNMLKYWSTETNKDELSNFTIIINLVRDTEAFLLQTQCSSLKQKVEYCDYEIAGGWQYDAATVSGDCGSLISVVNTGIPIAKLIGIHTAFGGGKGFAPKITRGDIEEALGFFDNEITDPIVSDEMDTLYNPNIPLDVIPGFSPQCYGRLVPTISKTNIQASPLQNTYFPSDMAPAPLRPRRMSDGTHVDPMDLARSKYSKSSYSLCPDILRNVTHDVLRRMTNTSVNSAPWGRPKVFNFEDAIRGVPGLEFCEGIPRGTSAGYPYKLDVPYGHSGKTHFFGRGDDYEFTSSYCRDLRIRVDDIIKKAEQGHRCLHVFTDFLKDERKPKAKVMAMKARMVSASPIDLLVAHRMYFLDFARWYMENRIKNGSAVGVNVYSSEWSQIANTLLSVAPSGGDCIIAGDYKSFDGSISTQIEEEVLHIVNTWYHDGNDRIRAVLWQEGCNSRHITGDLIYSWEGSNPSGWFMTTLLNTISNDILVEYAYVSYLTEIWKGISPENALLKVKYRYRTSDSESIYKLPLDKNQCWFNLIQYENLHGDIDIYDDYNKNVRGIYFGDDNIIGVSPARAKVFNQDILTDLLEAMGYTYTSESKDGMIVKPLRSISEVSFLKRQFIKSVITKTYICPLEFGVILEIPQWTSKKDVNNVITKCNVDVALRELSLHSPDLFQAWVNRISDASREFLQYEPECVDYNRLQLNTLARTELM